MSDPSGPSFIPKQNPVKMTRRVATRQVYFLSIISFSLFVGALLAAGAIFIYERYTTGVLAEEVKALNEAVSSFDEGAMRQVVELDERLERARGFLDERISINAILGVLESVTIDTIQFDSLTIAPQESGSAVEVTAAVTTDSFDSVIYQRQVYENAERIAAAEVEDVAISFGPSSAEGGSVGQGAVVRFSTLFTFNDETIGRQAPLPAAPSAVSTTTPLTTSPDTAPAP